MVRRQPNGRVDVVERPYPAAVTELRIRRIPTAELTSGEIDAVRAILFAAFGDDPEEAFTEPDWEHALGGIHVVGDLDGRIVAHASVVPRQIHVGGWPLATGYVEAVAVQPGEQRSGIGTAVMRIVGEIVAGYELGMLGTGEHGFYERLGWRTWRGPSAVRMANGERATPEDDGYLMVHMTPTSPPLDLDAPISCEWRSGDVW
jgi:aminoglycoside 2'-N-acetyltransferase I